MIDNYVRIFDTTLRDGEQSPGATLTSNEKLDIARMLARLGVDVMEAGFPAASPDDLEAVRQIALEVGNTPPAPGREPPVICGLARATRSDIDKAWEAVRHAKHSRIHTFLATSPIHMQYKLRMDPEEVVEQVREMVAYARSYCDDVEFSPEDAGRSNPEFLYLVLGEAIKAGATTLNIPDTVGYTVPDEFGDLIAGIMAHTPGIENVVVSVHCHNDLGLATANTLAGVKAGARQVEVTINGIGERAGNTSLEEVVMSLHTRRASYNLETGIDTTQITRASRMVSNYTGLPVQPNKAIVGRNAFAHSSGIHQDGVLKHRENYEIIDPKDVGVEASTIVLTARSGRAALKHHLELLGHSFETEKLDKIYEEFLVLADAKRDIGKKDLLTLIGEFTEDNSVIALEKVNYHRGETITGEVTLRIGKNLLTGTSGGNGPVDAVIKSIKQVIDQQVYLDEFLIQSMTKGSDDTCKTHMRLMHDGKPYHGFASDTDIVMASAQAFVDALNKIPVKVKADN